ERRQRFCKSKIDIRPQSVQRKASLERPFRTCDLSAVQTARDHHFDALCSEADRFFHRLLHCTAECDTLLKLLSDLLGLQLSIQLRMLDLKDRDQHVAACLACKIFAELID